MNFTALPVSSVDGIRLRHLAHGDLPAWFGYLSQREVFEHTSWNVSSPDALLPFVWSSETNTPDGLLRLAIVRADDDALIGTIGFHTVSAHNGTAEIAYDLVPAVWGRGIAASLCRAVVDWGHRHVGLVRIQATVLDSNSRSRRVLERCGFESEGLLRSYRSVRGTPRDFFMYAHVVEVPPQRAGPK